MLNAWDATVRTQPADLAETPQSALAALETPLSETLGTCGIHRFLEDRPE